MSSWYAIITEGATEPSSILRLHIACAASLEKHTCNLRYTTRHLPELRRACKRAWARNRVRCRLRPVHLELDTRIGALTTSGSAYVSHAEFVNLGFVLCSWEADGSWTGVASTRDIDLRTFHVELRAWVIARSVERDELGSKEISGTGIRSSVEVRTESWTHCPLGMQDGRTKSTKPFLLYSRVTAHSPLASMPSS